MENEIRVSTWEECEAKIRDIRRDNQNETPGIWFRGQSNADWQLITTLERRTNHAYSFMDYYRLALRIKPEIETVSGSAWEVPAFGDLSAWVKTYDHTHFGVLAYAYLAHLRHNGFPSPLLDWSHSPYVAAYFAFSGAKTGDVAIYVYSEQPDGMKSSSSSDPAIRALDRYVKTHRRHFRQQSGYTVCAQFDATNGWRFMPHQRVFDLQKTRYPRRTRQDILWKIIVPATERTKVMTLLDEFNLNAFSLFDSEESHMETLAFREIDLKPPSKLL